MLYGKTLHQRMCEVVLPIWEEKMPESIHVNKNMHYTA